MEKKIGLPQMPLPFEFSVDILLEEVDSLASAYIELNLHNILNFDRKYTKRINIG